MRTPCLGRSLLVLAIGVRVLPSCEPEACITAPCSNQVTVLLTSRPTVPYSIEILNAATRRVLATYECDGSSQCQQEFIFSHFEHVNSPMSIKVTTASGSLITVVRFIDYGPERFCRCPSATVTAEVPA